MKYKSFNYSHSGNLGDEVQTFATELHLPSVDGHVDRDGLALLNDNDEKFVVIMNGWYSNNPKNCLPAAKCVIPVFWGVHLSRAFDTHKYFLSGERLDYLKKHEPIGCRDPQTMEMIKEAGVDAFYSKCLTHTFPKREKEPENGKIFLADMSHIPVPNELYDGAVETTQMEKDYYGTEIRRAKSLKNLEMMRDEAKLVITSKIHCAMPCAAMGIPVIYFGNPNEYRVRVLKDMGLIVYQKPAKSLSNVYKALRKTKFGPMLRKILVPVLYSNVNWDPDVLEYEDEKNRLIKELKAHMKFCIDRHEASKND